MSNHVIDEVTYRRKLIDRGASEADVEKLVLVWKKNIAYLASKTSGHNGRVASPRPEEKDSQATQIALAKYTKQEIEEKGLTLFDIAPWPDHMRVMPNDFCRSALFTTRNRKVPRDVCQNKTIYHISKDVLISYTGIELRAEDDELVFVQTLEYAKHLPLGSPIEFTFYQLCKDIGWSPSSVYYKKAKECLARLQATALQFTAQRTGRLESLSLIRRFGIVDEDKRISRCQVEIDPEIAVLFAGHHYTKYVWEKYRKLPPIARRMFDYFSTHREPHPMRLETFRLICGSDSAQPRKWKQQVNQACGELQNNSLVESAWVSNDLIYCKR